MSLEALRLRFFVYPVVSRVVVEFVIGVDIARRVSFGSGSVDIARRVSFGSGSVDIFCLVLGAGMFTLAIENKKHARCFLLVGCRHWSRSESNLTGLLDLFRVEVFLVFSFGCLVVFPLTRVLPPQHAKQGPDHDCFSSDPPLTPV